LEGMLKKLAIVIICIILFFVFLNPVRIVGPGEKGIIIVLGKVTGATLDEGPHLVWPAITNVKTIDLRIQKDEIEAAAATKDLQDVGTTVVVNWQMTSADIAGTFRTIGDEKAILSRIINPAVNEVVKAATAKRTAENILIERAALKAEVDKALGERIGKFGITLIDLSFVHFGFSPEFNKAIEEKQIAEQQSKQAHYVALRAEQEAKAEVNKAEGQAKAQQLLSMTVTPKVLALEFFKKWDGHLPAVMGSNSTLLMNIDKAMEQAAIGQ
jgi:regulator of protease activity HflC (stomatin/prohibitin superfamily)